MIGVMKMCCRLESKYLEDPVIYTEQEGYDPTSFIDVDLPDMCKLVSKDVEDSDASEGLVSRLITLKIKVTGCNPRPERLFII